HCVILDARQNRLISLVSELVEQRQIHPGPGLRIELQPLIRRCLASWRTKLHHDHPFDFNKRSYHPVFSAIDQRRAPDRSATRHEIQYLSSTRKLLSELLDHAYGAEAIWKQRMAILNELESVLQNLAEDHQSVDAARSTLNTAEFTFRLDG